MAKIPPAFLQKIKEAVNILEIIGEHVVLRKSGANYSGLCPFHAERTPSFSVSEQKQLYHCYGCKRGGDLFTFVMEIFGIGFPEAIEELAERARLQLPTEWAKSQSESSANPEIERQRSAQREKHALAYKLNRFSASYFHHMLPQSPHIETYFKSRGTNPELIRNFYLGAAPAQWDALAKHLTSKKAPLALAAELGLIKPSQKKPGEHFDLFRNRAIFPIIDLRGKVAGFGGRALPLPEGAPEVGSESPKYLNSPDSLLFQKNRLVFGLYQAQKHIREKDEVILVEGYFDVLALHAAGFQNAVAVCGTALSPEHLSVFKKFASRIVVLFDSDQAGISATDRAMETGLEHGLVLYGAELPKGLDPDEVLFDQATGLEKPEGHNQMRTILTQAKPWLDFRIETEASNAKANPEAKSQAVKQIAKWLNQFHDPIGRAIREHTAQKLLEVPLAVLEKAMGSKNKSASRPPTLTHPKRPPPPSQLSKREKVLLSALALTIGNESTNPFFGKIFKLFAETRANLPPEKTLVDLFESPACLQFVQRWSGEPHLVEELKKAPELVIQSDLDPQIRSILTEAWISIHPQEGAPPIEEIELALKQSLARTWARFSQQIRKAIEDAETNQNMKLQQNLMKEYLDVQRKMKELSKFYDQA